jgi:predicted KAP-like P-loop ATPase
LTKKRKAENKRAMMNAYIYMTEWDSKSWWYRDIVWIVAISWRYLQYCLTIWRWSEINA